MQMSYVMSNCQQGVFCKTYSKWAEIPPPKSAPLISNLVVQDVFFYFCTASSDSTQVVPPRSYSHPIVT